MASPFSVEQCSTSSTQHVDGVGLSMTTLDNLSHSSSDEHNALKHLVAFAFIWGFGLSLLERYCRVIDITSRLYLCINILVCQF